MNPLLDSILNIQVKLFIHVGMVLASLQISILHPFQDYFSLYEMDPPVGGAKTEEPLEEPHTWHTPKQNLACHVSRVGLEPTPDTVVR